ncbi:hypothetical protein COV87_00760 [Candidatus Roizmanbacteria bacterium CG11_big_fil_rev_8_21_14_0_20_37_16]|uniref:Uncharacterized protein n=1 Tax=Candidatus Roizmanbacteria bacterium CG11_big_fil_rev_8_21_14_0_20_37_16 TaxID=1974857 RepID=A0A2H0KNC7_9BACT|nr:MAG: hypothetical protein COV87_00760 [Candidatus Roizmanbacteria bacterium CG11_big_fil_rev_8_21_14_0_20_37_16]
MLVIFLVIFGFAFLVLPGDVHAYLDPGTGSFMIQILIGAVLGSIYFIRLYWAKLKQFVMSFFSKKTNEKK